MNCLDCLYLKTIPKGQWPKGTKARMLAHCTMGEITDVNGEDRIAHLRCPSINARINCLHPKECKVFESIVG